MMVLIVLYRIYVGNQTVDVGPDDGKDTVIPVEFQIESPRISARLCAMDRNDLNRCFFTVEMWGPLPTDDDVHVEFWVQGPTGGYLGIGCFPLGHTQPLLIFPL